jgi:hypothetical protein
MGVPVSKQGWVILANSKDTPVFLSPSTHADDTLECWGLSISGAPLYLEEVVEGGGGVTALGALEATWYNVTIGFVQVSTLAGGGRREVYRELSLKEGERQREVVKTSICIWTRASRMLTDADGC